MGIEIRCAEKADKAAILAISAQIWGGTDYVPFVIEKWLKPELGILWVAIWDGVVAGFSRMTYIDENRCWLEGIRVDPAMRGKGVGKALTRFQMEESRRMGFKACALSSYYENHESLNIVRQHGFNEIAQFKFFDGMQPSETEQDAAWVRREAEAAVHRKRLLADCAIEPLGLKDLDFLLTSIFSSDSLKARSGYFSYDWTFETATPAFLEKRLAAGDFYRLSKQDASTLFSLSMHHAKGTYHTLNYVSDLSLEVEAAAYAYEQMKLQGENAVSYMALSSEKKQAFEALGYAVFNEEEKDVFVFERRE